MVADRIEENSDIERLYRNNGVLHRAFIFLEKGKFNDADQKCEQALDDNPENAMAYVGKLMVELKAKTLKELGDCKDPFDRYEYYQDAMKYGNDTVKEMLNGFIDRINERNEYNRRKTIYDEAIKRMEDADGEEEYRHAAEGFGSILGFEDAEEKRNECLEKAETCRKNKIYESAIQLMRENTLDGYMNAIEKLKTIIDWKDTVELINTCWNAIEELKQSIYHNAINMLRNAKEKQDYVEVSKLLSDIKGYKGTNQLLAYCMDEAAQRNELFINVVNQMIVGNKVMDKAIQMHWTITFGRYVQEEGEEPTPITWRVLAREDNRLLLISEYALDSKSYHKTWESVN